MSLSPFVLGVVAACGAAPLWPQNMPLTLHELFAKAEQSNQDVLAVRQRIAEANGLLRQAGIRPAPTLDTRGVTGRAFGTVGEEQFSAGLSKELERGSKRSRRIDVAEKQVELATADYEERVRQLRYELRLRYAEFAGEAARLDVLTQLMQAIQQSLDLTRARVERGDAAALEANLLLVELNRAEAQRASAAGLLEVARTELNRLAGFSAGDAPAIDASFLPPQSLPTREELVSRALAERPDLKTMRLQAQQGDAEQRLAEAQGRANVTVSASYGYVKSTVDDQFGLTATGARVPIRDRDDILSVGVSIPIFSKNRNQGNVDAAVARTRSAQLRKEFLEKSVPLEIEAAVRRLTTARNVFDVLRGVATTQGEANLDVIRQAYQLGQLRMLDVLNEQRRHLDTQLARASAASDLIRGWAELERAVGGEL